MIRRVILVLCFLIFSCNLAFADYVPIPQELKRQYKIEIEQIINEEYPIIIKDIKTCTIHAKSLKNKIIKGKFTLDDYIELALIPETSIPTADLDLYDKLLQTTYEKYLGTKYTTIGTDNVNVLEAILSPYMKDNNINQAKLNKIIKYEAKNIQIVEKYIKQVKKIRKINNPDIYMD